MRLGLSLWGCLGGVVWFWVEVLCFVGGVWLLWHLDLGFGLGLGRGCCLGLGLGIGRGLGRGLFLGLGEVCFV